MSALHDILTNPSALLRTSTRGRTTTLTFGVSDVRIGEWDRLFPVQVVKVWKMRDGRVVDGHGPDITSARSEKTLPGACRRIRCGWRVGAAEGWLELRTHPNRRKAEPEAL